MERSLVIGQGRRSGELGMLYIEVLMRCSLILVQLCDNTRDRHKFRVLVGMAPLFSGACAKTTSRFDDGPVNELANF